eukprot:scaffold152_cov128-Cylindrotheca_fusiformis.AAC.5
MATYDCSRCGCCCFFGEGAGSQQNHAHAHIHRASAYYAVTMMTRPDDKEPNRHHCHSEVFLCAVHLRDFLVLSTDE